MGSRYEILLPIAAGGMATVYLARARGHGGFERDVALKLTHPHLRESREFAADLTEEAKLASRVKHRNVVTILDVGEDPHGVFIVMEYVEGSTLAGLRRAAMRLPRPVALRILLDAMAGLHAAHETRDDDGNLLGLVHRDFSPQNILVGADGVARLADFGVAKAVNGLDMTQTGVIKGKVAYMSPEQARAERIDRRTDVWAAGVVAWELLARRRLYLSNEIGIAYRVATETPPRVRTFDSSISAWIDEVVARALTIDRDARWSTAAEFARELSAACSAARALADTEGVAAHVAIAMKSVIEKRRAAAADVLRLRRELGAIVSHVEVAKASTPRVGTLSMWTPQAAVSEPEVSDGTVSSTRRVQPRKGGRLRLTLGVVTVLLGVGALGIVTGQSGREAAAYGGDSPAPSQPPESEEPVPEPTAVTADGTSATPVPPRQPPQVLKARATRAPAAAPPTVSASVARPASPPKPPLADDPYLH